MNSATETPFIYFRLPAYPLSSLTDWLQKDISLYDALNCIEHDVSADFITKALYLSSPSVNSHYEQWLQSGKQAIFNEAIENTLWKYLSRMCSRSTPFGLMAGSVLGNVAHSAKLSIDITNRSLALRIDLLAYVYLYKILLTEQPFRTAIRYRFNNSYYLLGFEGRYSEFVEFRSQRVNYVNMFELTEAIDFVIQHSRDYISYKELVSLLDQAFQTGESDSSASGFVDDLIEKKLLISELEPGVCGTYYGEKLISSLADISYYEKLTSALSQLTQDLLSQQTISAIKSADSQLAAFFKGAHNEEVFFLNEHSSSLVQCNTYFNDKSLTLSTGLVGKVIEQLGELSFLAINPSSGLDHFRKRFSERYQGQEVSLLEVLDNEIGIGLGADGDHPLYGWMADLFAAESLPDPYVPDGLDELRLSVYERCLADSLYECDLDSFSVALRLKETVPATVIDRFCKGNYAVMGTFIKQEKHLQKSSGAEFDLHLRSCNGPSFANLLGRFCLDSSVLETEVITLIEKDAARYPDVIFAEIEFLAGARIGNVLTRPALREYGISYVTPSGAKEIPINELFIKIVNGRIQMRVKGDNRLIVPRLTTAHNYKGGDSVYQFLAMLQFEYEGFGLRWHWGLLQNRSYLPRIRYKNIILSPASWSLNSETPIADQLHALESRWKLPRYICIAEHDNELMIDRFSAVGINLLKNEIKRNGTCRVSEWLQTPDTTVLSSESNQKLAHEVIIPVLGPPVNYPVLMVPEEYHEPVYFGPDSEWLYIKLYTGPYTCDILINNFLPELIEQVTIAGVDHWFFIRYSDPDYHLRLRLHFDPRLRSAVLDILFKTVSAWQQVGIVLRYCLDTYQREIDRYGRRSMHLCEQLFHIDSQYCMELLPFEDSDQDRLILAVRSCIDYFNCFGFSLDDQITFSRQHQESFLSEQHESTKIYTLRKRLNDQYRKILPLLKDKWHSPDWDNLMLQRFNQIRPVAAQIVSVYASGPDRFLLNQILSSIIHMSVNRIFRQSNRKYETVVYHFVCRFLETQRARLK